jgi:hypothetical protein
MNAGGLGDAAVELESRFPLDEHELVYCGMALGYADERAAVNSLRSDRAPVEEFASFRGFAWAPIPRRVHRARRTTFTYRRVSSNGGYANAE